MIVLEHAVPLSIEWWPLPIYRWFLQGVKPPGPPLDSPSRCRGLLPGREGFVKIGATSWMRPGPLAALVGTLSSLSVNLGLRLPDFIRTKEKATVCGNCEPRCHCDLGGLERLAPACPSVACSSDFYDFGNGVLVGMIFGFFGLLLLQHGVGWSGGRCCPPSRRTPGHGPGGPVRLGPVPERRGASLAREAGVGESGGATLGHSQPGSRRGRRGSEHAASFGHQD